MSFLLGDLVDLTGEEVDAEKSLVQEYEMFVRETAVKGNADPLDWWKNKADSYKKTGAHCKVFSLYTRHVRSLRARLLGYWEYCYEKASKSGPRHS